MEPQVVMGLIAGCAALAGVLAFLSLHILRREPQYLRERSKRGEILLLTFDQVMALYNAAPEKWDMQVDSPTYYPHGKERDGLLVFMLPSRAWPGWATLRTGSPCEPRVCSVSTRFLGQPRLRDQTGRVAVCCFMATC